MTSSLTAYFAETRARRQQIAADYRAELLAELAARRIATGSASVSAIISSTVSAFVQMTELARQFECGRASSRATTQLGLARSELRRGLRTLGLVERAEGEEPPSGPTLAEWVEQREAGK